MEINDVVLCLGTYSGGLLGYKLEWSEDDHTLQQAKLSFAYSPHTGCIKSVRSRKALLLTGSTDETIRIFNLRNRQEQGILAEHSASISALDIFGDSTTAYALSGAEDGTLCLWRSSDWSKLAQLRGHTGPILAAAFHPSGRTTLTVSGGQERALRLWDLLRGTCAISQKFQEPPLNVVWGFNGELYGVLFSKRILVRHASRAHLEVYIDLPLESSVSLTASVFISARDLVLGDTQGNVWIIHFVVPDDSAVSSDAPLEFTIAYKLATSTEQKKVKSRVKSVCALGAARSNDADTLWFASVTSDGLLMFWALPVASLCISYASRDDCLVSPAKTISTGARVTAMDCTHSFDPFYSESLHQLTSVKNAENGDNLKKTRNAPAPPPRTAGAAKHALKSSKKKHLEKKKGRQTLSEKLEKGNQKIRPKKKLVKKEIKKRG